MVPVTDRRALLAGSLAGAALLLAGPGPARAAGTLAATRLGEGLHLVAGAGGNVVVGLTADGAVLVDGGQAHHAPRLLEALAALGAAPVHTLINTHWHPEHTGANRTLGAAGTRIVAHEFTRQWLGRTVYRHWDGRRFEALPPAARPTETFRDRTGFSVGHRRIECGHLPQAHTDGDIWVRFVDDDVLVAGDVAAVGRWPVLDYSTGGWIGGMLDGVYRLLELAGEDTVIVPGHGRLMTRDDLQTQYDMLVEMRERTVEMLQLAMSPGEMLAAGVADGYEERWGDPERFVHQTWHGLLGHLRYVMGGA